MTSKKESPESLPGDSGQDNRTQELAGSEQTDSRPLQIENLAMSANGDGVERWLFGSALQPLVELRHWIVWKWEISVDKKGQERKTKVPYQPQRPRNKASSIKPATWCDYETARGVALNGDADGVGFCLFNTGIAAFDLDDCRNPETGEIDAWAKDLVQRAGSYTEVTISGTGLRIIGWGNGPKVHRKQHVEGAGSLETYRKAERYIVMTGDTLPGTSSILANIDQHIDDVVAELDAKKKNSSKAAGDKPAPHSSSNELDDIIQSGCGERFNGDRSDAVWFVINELLRRGHYEKAIAATLLNKRNGISEHIYDQSSPITYVQRQIAKAIKGIQLSLNDKGKPYSSQSNTRIALLRMGVRVRYDRFADRMLIDGLDGFGPRLDDAGMDRLRLSVDQQYKFMPSKDLFYTIVQDTAQRNWFHPVHDYLDALKWDGVPRIDKWLTTYGGAVSSGYVDAVGALLLVAAVRRIRHPGCKFDEMVVLEGSQGTNKSTALAIMAVTEEWFTDDMPLNVDGKRVIEVLAGRWIVEAGELSGLTRADIGNLKAFLARQHDRGRMAYGRLTKELPRQCVIIGTTNDKKYLKDLTGNRRIWPVQVKQFDTDALARDRNQLWAEAVAREASGVSIRLDKSLWPAAADQQMQRTTDDPFFEALRDKLQDIEGGKIAAETVWDILKIATNVRGQEQSRRVTEAMGRLGWERPRNNQVKINGRQVTGFTKGPQPWKEVSNRDGADVKLSL